jgi:hypothetical protein
MLYKDLKTLEGDIVQVPVLYTGDRVKLDDTYYDEDVPTLDFYTITDVDYETYSICVRNVDVAIDISYIVDVIEGSVINLYEIHENGYLQCTNCGEQENFRIWQVTEECQEFVVDNENEEWYLKNIEADTIKGEIECLKCRHIEEIHPKDFDIDEIKLKRWLRDD